MTFRQASRSPRTDPLAHPRRQVRGGRLGRVLGRLDEIVFDCAEPVRLAVFWAYVLGGEPVHRSPDWSYVDPPGQPRLAFQRVPEGKPGKNRLHLDVAVDDLDEVRARLERQGAVSVGSVVTDEQGSFQIMYDPELNEFCLIV
jgi:Glyoxalase-like domain